MGSEDEKKEEYHFLEFEEDKKNSMSKLKLWICILFAVMISIAIIIIIVVDNMFIDHYDVIEKARLDENNMMEYEGRTYEIVFESDSLSSHTGKVRHISMSHEATGPMFTHDILLTNGDYANEKLSNPVVEDHHTVVYSRNGTINLIHAIPDNTDIYEQILDIEIGDIVTIEGYEVYYVQEIGANGRWQDAGCNTMYITSVTIE